MVMGYFSIEDSKCVRREFLFPPRRSIRLIPLIAVPTIGVLTIVTLTIAALILTPLRTAAAVSHTPVLVSLSVTPSIISVTRGTGTQFTATGTYDDGSTQNLTDSVTWSSDGVAAIIGSNGYVTAGVLGSANVTAASGSISNSAIFISILAGAITAFPHGLTFTPQPAGTTGTLPQVITVYNLGATTATVTNVAVSGTSFHLIEGAFPVTLAVGAFVNFTFSFTPNAPGTATANAKFYFDTVSPQTVSLSGIGTSTTAAAAMSSTSLTFAEQELGTISPPQSVKISNTGTTSFTIKTITTTDPFFTTGFSGPVKLKGGSSFNFQVNYAPNWVGPVTGSILITYDVLASQGMSLTGTGIAANALGISSFPILPSATQGAAYETILTAVGSVGQTNWSLASGSGLPSGLSLSSAGMITGTLSSSVAKGNYSATVQVTDSNTPPETAASVLTVPVAAPTGARCNQISWNVAGTKNPLVAISDLGTAYYLGQYQGGLYANGSNVDDPNHHAYGITMGQAIQPLDANGNYSPTGKYVLLAIGQSNTDDVFTEFTLFSDVDPATNGSLVVVDGANGSASADELQDPSSYFWGIINNSALPNASVTANQVEIVWLNDVDVSHPPTIGNLQRMLENIARNVLVKYPNIKILYLSSVNYTGYSNGIINFQPEPSAYETGFAAKEVIQDQINSLGNMNYNPANGPVVAPWAAWGPYYWTNGLLGRSDGLTWSCEDSISDGTHPSTAGRVKAAGVLLNFLKTDQTATTWYLAPASATVSSARTAK